MTTSRKPARERSASAPRGAASPRAAAGPKPTGRRVKIRSVTVIGRRWRDKTFGNTYHSVDILINGAKVVHLPFSYGGDRMYEQHAGEWLAQQGILPLEKHKYGGYEALFRAAERLGFVWESEVSDVTRKKDLD